MNYEQKNDEDIKDILTEDKNIDVQVREYNTYDVPLGILYGIAIYFFLQMIPIVGIADGLYISIKYWNRGRRLAVVTTACIFVVIAITRLIYFRFNL